MNETFNFNIAGVGTIPVSSTSGKEALDILQAYIDKRSLDGIIKDE